MRPVPTTKRGSDIPQLDEFRSTILDSLGNGSILLGPGRVREHWEPTQASVSVSSNVLESTCTLYLGTGGTASNKLQTTGTGSTGDVYGFGGFTMQPGQYVLAVWNGGDVGATATLKIIGTKGRYGDTE